MASHQRYNKQNEGKGVVGAPAVFGIPSFQETLEIFHQYNRFPLGRLRGYTCSFPHDRNTSSQQLDQLTTNQVQWKSFIGILISDLVKSRSHSLGKGGR